MVVFAGIEVLRDVKTRTMLSEIRQHIGSRNELLEPYGGELHGATRMMKAMLLSIIPKEIKTETLKE